MKYNNSTTGFFLCRKLFTLFVVCLAVAVFSCTQLYEAFGDTEAISFYVPGNLDTPNQDGRTFSTDNPPTIMWIDATGSVRREPISALVAGQRDCNEQTFPVTETASGKPAWDTECPASSEPALDAERLASGEPSFETERPTYVSITVSKGLVTPVLLFYDDYAHPEGFIYPYEAEFTEAGGFAAHILYRLIHESDGDKNAVRLYCSHFNWKKFLQSVRKLDDPWQCNQTLILQSIADGTFKANTLKTGAK